MGFHQKLGCFEILSQLFFLSWADQDLIVIKKLIPAPKPNSRFLKFSFSLEVLGILINMSCDSESSFNLFINCELRTDTIVI